MTNPPLYIAIASRNGQAMVHSITTLLKVAHILDRQALFVTGEASNIPRARNNAMSELRMIEQSAKTAWVLWMDSDIYLLPQSADALAKAILWAENPVPVAVTASYRMADGYCVMLKDRAINTRHWTTEEYRNAKDWAPVGMTGFGLLYLPMPLDYTFRSDALGEDIHFWLDHPDMPLYLAKDVEVLHRKEVYL